MTVIQAIEALLETNWQASITGRHHDVPAPEFVQEQDEMQKRLRTQDVAHVIDGGDEEHTPLGFGWTHETIDAVVTVQLRSADRRIEGTPVDSRIRTFGYRNTTGEVDQYGLDPLEAERWGGLAGETKRLILANRKGFAEFDIVGDQLRVQDQSDLAGTGYHRADVQIPLTNIASEIDTSP